MIEKLKGKEGELTGETAKVVETLKKKTLRRGNGICRRGKTSTGREKGR